MTSIKKALEKKKELEQITIDMAQIYFDNQMDTTESIIAFVVSIDDGYKMMVVPKPALEDFDWKAAGENIAEELAARGHEVIAAFKVNIQEESLLITIVDNNFNHYFDIKEYDSSSRTVNNTDKVKTKWNTVRQAKKDGVCDMFLLDIFYKYINKKLSNYIELDKKKI